MSGTSRPWNMSPTVAVRNVGSEVSRIADIIRNVEDVLFDWAKAHAEDADLPVAFHQLDLLLQSVEELARYLNVLSERLPSDMVLDISKELETVRLARLKQDLGRPASDRAERSGNAETNQVELF